MSKGLIQTHLMYLPLQRDRRIHYNAFLLRILSFPEQNKDDPTVKIGIGRWVLFLSVMDSSSSL